MRVLPSGLQAHLDTGATTLCWCWRITRRDGVRLGFTDHDRDIVFDGVSYEAAAGLTGTEISERVGLGVDNLEVEGVLTSEHLAAADLAAGLYDNAAVDIFRVNWHDPGQRILLRSGTIGEVRRGALAFSAEIRGLTHELQQEKGRLFQRTCDANLGDRRCGVDLSLPQYRANASVTAVLSSQRFRASGLAGFATNWFAQGQIRWTGGANAGRAIEVRRHVRESGIVTIDTWQPMAHAIAVGDAFEVTAGCDRHFATCRTKFDNVVRFRGFPHMPGNDRIMAYPNRDDATNDGGSLVR